MQRTLTLYLIVAMMLFAGQVFAQITLSTGTIYGKVVDEKSAPLPGVTVTAETGGVAPRTVVTGPGGSYRFAALPIGTYTVSFTLSGFTELRQEDIRLTAQQNVELNTTLKQSPEEVLVVSGAPPAVDTKKTSSSTGFTSEYLNNIPSARDPWVIFDQTPGIDVDRVNVGGNESGQQSNFFSKGGDQANNLWSVDGINFTDPAAQGSSPRYFDFEAFEEIQIVTAGHDASMQTGGVNINLITKRGGNTWSGTGSARWTGDQLQGENITDEIRSRGLTLPVKVDQVWDAGGDAGGPILTDRAWIWGAYRYNSIRNFVQTPDATQLEEYNLKGNLAYNSSNEGSFQYNWSNKTKQGRFSSVYGPGLQSAGSTWDQDGPSWIFKAEHSVIPNSNLFIDGKYIHVRNSFTLDPKDGCDVPMITRSGTDFFLDQSSGCYSTARDQNAMTVDANWFKQNWLGGDHEFKFGFDYGQSHTTSFYQYAGGIHVYDYANGSPYDLYYPWVGDYIARNGVTSRGDVSAGAGFAVILADYTPDFTNKRTSFYFQDTFRRNRLTLNLGGRVDIQKADNGIYSNNNTIVADLIPTWEFQSAQADVTFTDFSPRLGFTYDLTGKGNAIVRGNYSRFYDIYNPAIAAQVNPGSSIVFAFTPYSDLNADGVITRDEILEDALTYFGYSYFFTSGLVNGLGQPITPDAFANLFSISSDLKNTTTDEFLVGAEFQIGEASSIGGNFTHRRYDNLIFDYVPGVTSSDFTCAPQTITAPTGEQFTLNFCDTPSFIDGGVLLNPNGRRREYNGVELLFNKRMADRWMMRVSATIQDQKLRFDNDGTTFGGAFQDPSNIPYVKDTWYAFRSAGSGGSIVFPASRWNVKVSGAYQFPHDITVGAYLKVTDGNVVPLQYRAVQTFLGAANTGFVVAPFDQERLETLTYMDVSVNKRFGLGNAGSLTLDATVFNLFNTNEVLSIQNRTNSNAFRNILQIVNPRILRLGAIYSF
jgi:hypothetical protein